MKEIIERFESPANQQRLRNIRGDGANALLATGAEADTPVYPDFYNKTTLFAYAIEQGAENCVRLLLERESPRIGERELEALVSLCEREGRSDKPKRILESLLQHGANPNTWLNGISFVRHIARYGTGEMLAKLEEYGAELDRSILVDEATKGGNTDTLAYLTRRIGDNVPQVGGTTLENLILHLRNKTSGAEQMLSQLLEMSLLEPNARFNNNKIPLVCEVAKNGTIAMLKLLKEKGADLTAVDFWGKPAFIYALEGNNVDTFDYLTGIPHAVDRDYKDKESNNLFHYARNAAMTARLLKLGVDFNYDCGNEHSPLLHAVLRYDTESVKLLMDAGASPYPENASRTAKLQSLARFLQLDRILDKFAFHHEYKYIMDSLLERFWNQGQERQNALNYCLLAAAKFHRPEWVDTCLQQGADIRHSVRDGITALGQVFRCNTKSTEDEITKSTEDEIIAVIQALMKKGAEVSPSHGRVIPPLITAIENNQPKKIISYLIEQGADVDSATPEGWSALQRAIAAKELDSATVELLLEEGARNISLPLLYKDLRRKTGKEAATILQALLLHDIIQPDDRNDRGERYADWARQHNMNIEPPAELITKEAKAALRERLLKQAISKGKMQTIEKHLARNTPLSNDTALKLLKKALNHGQAEIFKLIATQVNPDVLKSHLRHLFESAATASRDSETTLRSLLQCASRLECLSFHNMALLHIKGWNSKQISILLQNGAELEEQDDNGYTPLHSACSPHTRESKQAAHLLRAGANPHASSGDGHTPLTLACSRGTLKSVRALAEHGAQFNVPAPNGTTPLIACITGAHSHGHRCDRIKTLSYLLKRGADANQRNADGCTPLMAAILGDYPSADKLSILNLLVRHGADRSQCAGGRKPIELAEQRGESEEICHLLTEKESERTEHSR